MSEMPDMFRTLNTLPEPEKHGRCTNPRHRLPAGWCPTCDAEWDHSDDLSERELQEGWDLQLQDWKAKMDAAQRTLDKLKAAEPRDIVAIVEQRKIRNKFREEIENMGYRWRVGGNAPTKRDGH